MLYMQIVIDLRFKKNKPTKHYCSSHSKIDSKKLHYNIVIIIASDIGVKLLEQIQADIRGTLYRFLTTLLTAITVYQKKLP